MWKPCLHIQHNRKNGVEIKIRIEKQWITVLLFLPLFPATLNVPPPPITLHLRIHLSEALPFVHISCPFREVTQVHAVPSRGPCTVFMAGAPHCCASLNLLALAEGGGCGERPGLDEAVAEDEAEAEGGRLELMCSISDASWAARRGGALSLPASLAFCGAVAPPAFISFSKSRTKIAKRVKKSSLVSRPTMESPPYPSTPRRRDSLSIDDDTARCLSSM
mmetsp:Transcript_43804/g.114230  ORF Transcript_43804/g.114230 Transcript_43804/m.114230 type:complete len:220 (+) Transcript_43804:1016-1675(+)